MNEANRRLSPARIPGGFSGPTAIAAVTGRPIRDVLGTVGNGFMSMTEIGSAIRNLGGQCSEDRRLLLDRQQSRGYRPRATTPCPPWESGPISASASSGTSSIPS